MAARRGLGNSERLGLDATHASASVTMISAPCFVYGVTVALIDMSATGLATLGDVSASADIAADAKALKVKLGPAGTSGGVGSFNVPFNPPLYVQRTLAATITNTEVTVRYLPAS